jgi:hypothetical protein
MRITEIDNNIVNEISLKNFGDYHKKAQLSQASASMNKFFNRDDPEKVADADKTIAKREKGLKRHRSRVDKYWAERGAKEKAEREQAIRDKYANVDIDAEIAKLQPAIKSAYNDYQYGARNTWHQGKEKYDQLSAKVRELEHAKKLLGGLNEASPGYEGIPPDAKCSSCGTPYSKHFRFDADGNIESTTIRGLCGRPQHFKSVSESATAGATMAANIGTVDAPQLSPGKARGKKSYTGSPTTGSGTKAPPQPVVKQPKKSDGTAVNALDMKGANLFGSGTVKRS